MYRHLYTIIMLMFITVASHAQIIGQWKAVGDKDGDEKAIIEIYEQNGKLFGKVTKLLPGARITRCENCPGDLKDKPIEGMVVLKNLRKTALGGVDGKITDPSNGKTYNCAIELQDRDTIKVRGYIGMPAVGRTQYWKRVR